jgi:MFS family permease
VPALLLICAAQFMLVLDVSIVNVALPTIQADWNVAGRASGSSPATRSRSVHRQIAQPVIGQTSPCFSAVADLN